MKLKRSILAWTAVAALTLVGCGGGGGGGTATTTGTAPTAQSEANVESQLGVTGAAQLCSTFATFGHGLPLLVTGSSNGPTYVSQLGLWMTVSVSGTTFTETFYQDQAETEPAGSAVYTLNASTETLSGNISITAGADAGLAGTFSQTLTKNGTTGTYNVNLPSRTQVACTFSVSIGATGIPSGTGTETVTESNGYSETATIVYNSDGTKVVTASDSNGYTAVLHFASDNSGSGTISGSFPGLPATVVWNSTGGGAVTFANGLVVRFTDWQVPPPPSKHE